MLCLGGGGRILMLGWTKGQELWGKGRRPGRKREWCKAQLMGGKSEVRNGCWGSRLRLGLGGRRVRQGRVGLEGRRQAVWLRDPGARSWVDTGCWGQLSPLPQPLAQCWTWLRVENNWGREPSCTQVVWPHSPACLQNRAGETGHEQVLVSLCPSAQLCNLIAPGAISRWATAATQLPFQNLSSIFLSFPTAVWWKESATYS